MRVPLMLILSLAAAPLPAEDFWKHWGDGRAELSGYRLSQPRYGSTSPGAAVLVFVTESFADGARVKSDAPPGSADAYPVVKLNHIRDFQTGIYDYATMTSVFARVASGFPVRKISFSSREWCGHVWHQLLPAKGTVPGVFHSYFEGEADGRDDLPFPEGGVFEDALPILLRGLTGEYLKAGESRKAPFLPSLFASRMTHTRLAWGQATFTRGGSSTTVKVPAGSFEAIIYTVAQEGGPTSTWAIESSWPHRLLKRTGAAGEEAVLLRSSRQSYWKQNQPGAEKLLAELGLRPPSRLP